MANMNETISGKLSISGGAIDIFPLLRAGFIFQISTLFWALRKIEQFCLLALT